MSSKRPVQPVVRAMIAAMLLCLGMSFVETFTVSAKDSCTSQTCPGGKDSECGGNCTCSMPGNSCIFWP